MIAGKQHGTEGTDYKECMYWFHFFLAIGFNSDNAKIHVFCHMTKKNSHKLQSNIFF
jgi:hypothetical protein